MIMKFVFVDLFRFRLDLVRLFPQNIRAIMAKFKIPKKPHSMVIF